MLLCVFQCPMAGDMQYACQNAEDLSKAQQACDYIHDDAFAACHDDVYL